MQNGLALQYTPTFQNDPEIVRIAVEQNGLALRCAPDYQNDPEIVRIAIAQNGLALQYVPTFQNDPEIVHIAVEQNGNALEHARARTRSNPHVHALQSKKNPSAVLFIGEALRNNPDIILFAILQESLAAIKEAHLRLE